MRMDINRQDAKRAKIKKLRNDAKLGIELRFGALVAKWTDEFGRPLFRTDTQNQGQARARRA
jgi:hypothetical protein